MCVLMCSGHTSVRIPGTHIIRNSFSRSGLTRSDTFLPLFSGSRQFVHFHCSSIEDATQQRPFPSHCLRFKPSHEFPPGFQACASRSVLYKVQRFSFQKLHQCEVDLRIDSNGIRTCFDVVSRQYWCFLLCCPIKSVSRRCDRLRPCSQT